jgi:hypothetical protein
MGSFLAPVSMGRIGAHAGISVPCSMSGVTRQCRPAGHLDDARGVTPPLLRNVDTLAWLTRHSIAETVWKEGTAILLVFAALGLYGVVACAVSASCRAPR